jgi:hypothetical protein
MYLTNRRVLGKIFRLKISKQGIEDFKQTRRGHFRVNHPFMIFAGRDAHVTLNQPARLP